ncbi:PRC-barrel domain-containing protein [Rhodovulum sp. ES.010]|nr:PRC-barrel domain-containing protein [Rhodovulum sp. ES.010]
MVENGSVTEDGAIAEVPDGWTEIGEIADVYVSGAEEIEWIVTEIDGAVDAAPREVAFELGKFRFKPDPDTSDAFFVVYEGNRAALEAREQRDRADMEPGGRSLARDTDGDGATAMASMDDAAVRGAGECLRMSEGDRAALRAESLERHPVLGPDGAQIGEIGALVIGDAGEMERVVVEVGGFLGLGEKRVALPFTELSVARTDGAQGWRVSTEHSAAVPRAIATHRPRRRYAASAAASRASAVIAAQSPAFTLTAGATQDPPTQSVLGNER